MFSIIRSLLIVAAISVSVGGAFYLLGYPFINVFAVTFVAQLILGALTNTIRDAYISLRSKYLDTEAIAAFSKQGAELTCSFCNARVFAPIRLDEDNEFKCPSCENVNSIYVNITVARSTTPLDTDPVTTLSLVDDEEEAKETIRNG